MLLLSSENILILVVTLHLVLLLSFSAQPSHGFAVALLSKAALAGPACTVPVEHAQGGAFLTPCASIRWAPIADMCRPSDHGRAVFARDKLWVLGGPDRAAQVGPFSQARGDILTA
jgi:hypothetical protein